MIAGRLMGLNAAELAHADALSATHGNTLAVVRTGQLANSKANAMVASQAVLCSLFAAEGMTGSLGVIEHPRGLSTGMLGQAERLLPSGDAEAAGVPLHVFQGWVVLSCCCLVIVRPDHRESSEARHIQHSRPSLNARNDICRGMVTA